jgi:GT2 family glycosyltransferase
MKLAVLMTCYNRVETTLRCLRLLYAQNSDAELSVYLVDDASPDKTGMRVKTDFPEVNVINGTGVLYWSRGMALAWRSAVGDFDAYLWLNDDVFFNEGALQQLIEDAHATRWEGAIIGSFLDVAGNMTYGVMEDWKWVEPMGLPRETKGDISGNCVLIPKSVFEKVGIIADCYSHAYGDYDYSARMRKIGIPYYLSSTICGRCDNDKPDYALESKSLFKRIACLFRPNGHNWRDAVVYRLRHYGILRAFVTAVHVPYLVIKGRKKR